MSGLKKISIEHLIAKYTKDMKYGSKDCLLNREDAAAKSYLEELVGLRAQLAAERDKYAELQRYNVDCTKQCDALLVENQQLRAAWGLLGAVGHEREANNGKDV